jgi:hypothetical protein
VSKSIWKVTGLAALLGEGGRHLELWARHVAEDDPLGLHDLDEDDEAPGAARPQVELLKGVREPLRGCVEDARGDDLPGQSGSLTG